jgi:hypothetical protein
MGGDVDMRLVVFVVGPDNLPVSTQTCEDGDPLTVRFNSPYLISAGQEIELGISVFDADKLASRINLLDARHLTTLDEDGIVAPLIDVPVVWDVSFIPTRRLLADILEEAVEHGREFPSHGVNCACMDRLVREIRLQVSKAIPPDGRTTDSDWAAPIHDRVTAKARIRSVLQQMERNL